MVTRTLHRRSSLWCGLLLLSVIPIFGLAQNTDAPQTRDSSTVGMPGKIDQLVLPGSELEVKPLEDRRTPLVLRITEVYPHGSAFRYSLVYYGLEPGQYDLRNYLTRKDGTALGDVPPIPVKVAPCSPRARSSPMPWPWSGLHGLEVIACSWRRSVRSGAPGWPPFSCLAGGSRSSPVRNQSGP